MIAPTMPIGPQTKNAAIDVTSEPIASPFVGRAGGYAYGEPYGDRGGDAVGGVSCGSLMLAE
jgi:hypothetical protein